MNAPATLPRYDSAQVKAQARGRWSGIFLRLLGMSFPEGKEGPCPRSGCGGKTRCRFTDRDGDGSVYCSHCMTDCGDGFAVLQAVLGISFPEAVQRVGEFLGTTPAPKQSVAKPKPEKREPAPVDVLHEVYSAILARLTLSDAHRQNLRDRGLSDSTIDLEGYRTLDKTSGDERAACSAATAGLNGHTDRIPGIKDGRLIARSGILIPVRNLAGQVVALKVRRDEVNGDDPRYTYVSSSECSCGSPVHVPKDAAGRHSRIRATEGELKATIATELSGQPTITAGSVSNWKKLEPVLREMGASTVVLAFDADSATNANVAKQLAAAHDGLTAAGFNVELEVWDPGQGKGIDDLLAAGGKPSVLTNVAAAAWLDKNTGKTPHLVGKTAVTTAKTRVSPTTSLYQPFPVDVFPGVVGEFVKGSAAALNVDPVFVGLPTLAVMAGAIGATRQVLPKRGYTEPAVIWGAIVAESGSKKSPALDAPCKPIVREELKNIEEYQQKRAIYESEMTTYRADLAAWSRSGRKAGEPAPEEPEAPLCRRTIVSDITIEALAAKLKDNPRGLVSKHDELSGFFSSMNQYRSGGKGADEAKYLSMFGARELFVDRKGGTLVIPRAAVSIIGSVQPGILKRLLTREHFESGMSARFLLAFPPARVSLWTEDEIPEDLETAFGDTIQKLQRLDFNQDEDGTIAPVYCPFTAEAKALWIDFYNQNAKEAAQLTGDLSAAWSKLCGYAARFALVLRFARWAQGSEWEAPKCIDAEAITAGITLSRWFANETRRVYSILREKDEDRESRELFELIMRHGGSITPRDLAKASRRFADSEQAEVALQSFADAGIGTWQNISSSSLGGRPSRRLTLKAFVGETQANRDNDSGFAGNAVPSQGDHS